MKSKITKEPKVNLNKITNIIKPVLNYKLTCAILLSMTSSYALAADLLTMKAVNYDPAHSVEYKNAQQNNDFATMVHEIDTDLYQIRALGFDTIKTFFSQYCTQDGKQCLNIAKENAILADNYQKCDENALSCDRQRIPLDLYVGVYQFMDQSPENNLAWTDSQIKAAIDGARFAIDGKNPYHQSPSVRINQYVKAIIVGNENSHLNGMPQRLVKDISTIKKDIAQLPNLEEIKVGTAQIAWAWDNLVANDPHGVIAATDFLGTNIYPFWGQSPEKINDVSVAVTVIPDSVNKLSQALQDKGYNNKEVVVTEEGWSSCGTKHPTHVIHYPFSNINNWNDYYANWENRIQNSNFGSFYFSVYDKGPAYNQNECEGKQADQYFGICSNEGLTKSGSNIDCTGALPKQE